MPPRRTLFIDEQGLTAYRFQGGQWIAEGLFSQTAAAQANFSRYLQQHRQQRFYLLVDLAQEEMLVDTIPKLRGSDRQALIERRLAQHFPERQLRCASTLGFEKAATPRERLRLATLPETPALTDCLATMAAQHSLLAGIYSISQLLVSTRQQLCSPAPQLPDNALLLLKNQHTLRQFFLHDGELKLLRSVAVDQKNGQQIVEEAERLQHYLLNQHLLVRGHTLPVLVLGSRGGPAEMAINSKTLAFHYFPQITEPRTLFLTALAQHPPPTQFASHQQLQPARRARQRFACHLFATLLALSGLPLTAANFHATAELRAENQQLLAAINDTPTRSDTPVENTPRLSASTLRHLRERYDELQQAQQLPHTALRQLSRILEQHPAIQLTTLSWQNHSGGERLSLTGHLEGSDDHAPENRERQLAQFIAALRVDRDRQVERRNQPAAMAAATWPSKHEPASRAGASDFHIDIGPRP